MSKLAGFVSRIKAALAVIGKWFNGVEAPKRRRDNCPAWVKDEAIARAIQKRVRRAARRREEAYSGGWGK